VFLFTDILYTSVAIGYEIITGKTTHIPTPTHTYTHMHTHKYALIPSLA